MEKLVRKHVETHTSRSTRRVHLGEVAKKVKEVVTEDILRPLLHSSVKNWLTASSGSENK